MGTIGRNGIEVSAGAAGQRTSYSHWQLRDLVQIWQDDIFCVKGSRVIKYSPDTAKAQLLPSLSFEPTCVAVNEGYVAVGGSRNELAVFEQRAGNDSKLLHSSRPGGSVNNAVHIFNDTGWGSELFVCNNDHTISVFSLPDVELKTTVRCGSPVNYSALSPDGRQLVAVCDNHETQVYARDALGGFTRYLTHKHARDAGICCDWNSTGSCYAVGNQDNYLRLYDSRSQKLVLRVKSTLDAVRNVKFSKCPVDLLSFMEHRQCFSVVDLRNPSTQQVVTAAARDEDLTGMCFSSQGTKLYLGMSSGIKEYGVDTAARLTLDAFEFI